MNRNISKTATLIFSSVHFKSFKMKVHTAVIYHICYIVLLKLLSDTLVDGP